MPYPQTFVGIQDSVIAKLRLDDTDTNRDLVKDWINQSYAQVAEETQALQQAGVATLTSGSATYALPDKLIELKQVVARSESETLVGPPLERVSLDTILRWRSGNGGTSPVTGGVCAYALLGLDQLELWPTPTDAGVIEFYYSYLPDALVNDGDIAEFQEPWGSKCLEYGALVQAAEMQADPLLDRWQQDFQDMKTRFRVHMTRRGGSVDQFPVYRSRLYPRNNSADVCY